MGKFAETFCNRISLTTTRVHAWLQLLVRIINGTDGSQFLASTHGRQGISSRCPKGCKVGYHFSRCSFGRYWNHDRQPPTALRLRRPQARPIGGTLAAQRKMTARTGLIEIAVRISPRLLLRASLAPAQVPQVSRRRERPSNTARGFMCRACHKDQMGLLP